MMLRDVAALLVPGVHPFELSVLAEVFGVDRTEEGLPAYDFAVVATGARTEQAVGGMTVTADHGLERLASADLVAIPGWHTRAEPAPEPLVAALRAAYDRGATLLSVCSGAFLLAATGLLDGRRATTHWRYAAQLARLYPRIRLDPDVLYVPDGRLVTGAGTSAGIDACLYLVREAYGADIANRIARRMVVPPHREGGQAQYVEVAVPAPAGGGADLAELLDWLAAHPDRRFTVEDLARRAHLSPRTFARRFRQSTGTTPYEWLTLRRLSLAQRLLETGDLGVDAVARRSGFGTAKALREQFTRRLGTTPQVYRRTFSQK
jgi:transcriptional regulator GlxA family with amidase domain